MEFQEAGQAEQAALEGVPDSCLLLGDDGDSFACAAAAAPFQHISQCSVPGENRVIIRSRAVPGITVVVERNVGIVLKEGALGHLQLFHSLPDTVSVRVLAKLCKNSHSEAGLLALF